MAVKIRRERQSHRFHSMKLLGHDNHGPRSGDVYLNVTALVDMMTVLVIFLIMNFNATGDLLFISKDLTMPKAEHGQEVTRVPIVSLSKTGELYFDGVIIFNTNSIDFTNPDWRIVSLEEHLRQNTEANQRLTSGLNVNYKDNPTTTVNVQVDKGVDFKLIKRVLYTCEQAGYGTINLAVGDGRKASATEGAAKPEE